MNDGQMAFSQLMAHGSRFLFDRCIRRYDGNRGVRSFSCRDQSLAMAFAQLTDIEACRGAVPETDFAQRLVVEARRLDIDEPLGLEEIDEREQVVYALDATTIDLCLSVCVRPFEKASLV